MIYIIVFAAILAVLKMKGRLKLGWGWIAALAIAPLVLLILGTLGMFGLMTLSKGGA